MSGEKDGVCFSGGHRVLVAGSREWRDIEEVGVDDVVVGIEDGEGGVRDYRIVGSVEGKKG